jgi:hypothetical protein
VQSISGLDNWTADAQGVTRVDAGFVEVLELLNELPNEGIVGFGFEAEAGQRTAHLLLEEDGDRPRDPKVTRLLELLDLDPSLTRFPIRFGFGRSGRDEIRIYTRSLLEIMSNLAAQIEVPPGDVAAGRTYATETSLTERALLPDLSVRSRPIRPINAFVGIEYRGNEAKRVFSVLLLLLNLVDKSGEVQLPVITIPTG